MSSLVALGLDHLSHPLLLTVLPHSCGADQPEYTDTWAQGMSWDHTSMLLRTLLVLPEVPDRSVLRINPTMKALTNCTFATLVPADSLVA